MENVELSDRITSSEIASQLSNYSSSILSILEPCQSCKPVVVSDIDETLLHCYFSNNFAGDKFKQMEIEVGVEEIMVPNKEDRQLHLIEIGQQKVIIYLRPGVRKFLKHLHQHYDIGLWSAGERRYVEKAASLLFLEEQRAIHKDTTDDNNKNKESNSYFENVKINLRSKFSSHCLYGPLNIVFKNIQNLD